MSKDTFKVKRLRDDVILTLKTQHALNLLRLDAKDTKRHFELAEPNYTFSGNEIHSSRKNRPAEESETQRED